MIRNLVVALAAALLLAAAAAVKDMGYYDTLGITPDADERAVKKAYKKMAIQWHPDKNLDNKEEAEKKFQQIAAAYEVLSNSEKRQVYDQYGEEGLEGHGQGGPGDFGGFGMGMDPRDLFAQFFGEGGMPEGFEGGNVQFSFTMEGDDDDDDGGGFGDFFGGMGGGMGGMPEGMGGFFGGMGGGMGGGMPEGMEGMFGGGGMPEGMFGGMGGMGGMFGGDDEDYQEDPFEGSGIEVLSPNTFPSKGDFGITIAFFYFSEDPKTAKFAPKYLKVEKALKGIARVVLVQCDIEERFCLKKLGKKPPFPAIRSHVGGGDGELGEFAPPAGKGVPDSKTVLDWAFSVIPESFVNVVDTADAANALVARAANGGGKASGTSWGAVVLLFSSKPEPSPLYKSIAHYFRGNLAFGQAPAEGDVAQSFGVTEVPAVVAVCNGDRKAVFRYEGAFKSDPLHKFMREFRMGRKCAEAVRLEEGTDITKLRVGQLKALLEARGEKCIQCLEKEDFVKRVREVLAADPKP